MRLIEDSFALAWAGFFEFFFHSQKAICQIFFLAFAKVKLGESGFVKEA